MGNHEEGKHKMQTQTAHGRVLQERNTPPHKIEMIYWGPGEPLSVVVTNTMDDAQQWFTPDNQQDLLDCFNHPFSDFWQTRQHLPEPERMWE